MSSTAPSASPSSSNNGKRKAPIMALMGTTAMLVAGWLTGCSPSLQDKVGVQKASIENVQAGGDLLLEMEKMAHKPSEIIDGNAFTNVYNYLRESAGFYDNMGTDAEDGATFEHEEVSYRIATRQDKNKTQTIDIEWTSEKKNKKKQKVAGHLTFTFGVDKIIYVEENGTKKRRITDIEFRELIDLID